MIVSTEQAGGVVRRGEHPRPNGLADQVETAGVWLHDGLDESRFECDACGRVTGVPDDIPLACFSDTHRASCPCCGAVWTHLLGAIGRDGQLRFA